MALKWRFAGRLAGGLMWGLPLLGAPFAAQAEDIVVLVYDRPPLFTVDGAAIGGLVVEPVKRIFAEAGLSYRWQVTSAKAALRIVEENAGAACAPGWFYKPARERFGRYTLGFFLDAPRKVLYREGDSAVESHRSYASLLADQTLRMGVREAYSYGPQLDRQIEQLRPPRVFTNQDADGQLRMLVGGRFDYFTMAGAQADYLLGNAAFGDKVTAQVMDDVPAADQRRIICSLATPDEVIDRLNRAIRTLRLEPVGEARSG